MDVGSRSDSEALQVGRFGFDRLERSVEFLIEEHERLSAEHEALLAELVDREHRIASLESRLSDDQNKRAMAAEGVEKILARLEQLRRAVTAKAEAGS